MGRGTGLNADRAGRLLPDIAALQLAAYDHPPLRANAVDLKNQLCDYLDRFHLCPLARANCGRLARAPESMARECRWRSRR
jgi:hypothetical protein